MAPFCLGLLVLISLLAPATAQGPSRKLQHGAGSTSRKLQEDVVPVIPVTPVRKLGSQLQQFWLAFLPTRWLPTCCAVC